MTEEITTIVSSYLEAHEQTDASETDLDELREKHADWKSKMEDLDEDDPLFEVAEENYEDYDERIEEIEQSENSLEKWRTELLQTTAERFIPRGDWTNEKVLRALNDALVGEERDYIKIDTVYLEPGVEVEDDERLFEIATAVRSIAEEELGDLERLDDFWNEFQELKRFRWFKQIANANEPLSGKNIAERIGEEDQRQAISQNLIDTTKGGVNPYFKAERGKYSLSLVGEYLHEEYSNFDDGEEDSEDEDGNDDSDSDATLDKFE